MRQFSIPMLDKFQRPVIELYELYALIDTGAAIPMLSMADVIVQKMFNGKKQYDSFDIGGIGGACSGSIYSMEEFRVGEMVFSPFEFFVPNRARLSYPILLSATLFYGTDYGFDTNKKQFHVEMDDNCKLRKSFLIKQLEHALYPEIDGVLLQNESIFLTDISVGWNDVYVSREIDWGGPVGKEVW